MVRPRALAVLRLSDDDVGPGLDELGREVAEMLWHIFCEPLLDTEVSALNVAELSQGLAENRPGGHR
jgi:hypothetical protein